MFKNSQKTKKKRKVFILFICNLFEQGFANFKLAIDRVGSHTLRFKVSSSL